MNVNPTSKIGFIYKEKLESPKLLSSNCMTSFPQIYQASKAFPELQLLFV